LSHRVSRGSGIVQSFAIASILFVIVVFPPFLSVVVVANAQATSISIDSPYTARMHVYKGQFHAHTTNSEGCNSPREVAMIYKNLGFNFTSITDHDYLTPDPEVPGILYIPGVEETTQPDIRHILSINSSAQVTQTEPQSVIDSIDAQGAIAVIAHPSFSAMTQSDLQALNGFSMIEIDDERLWDGLLTAGRRVFAVASDDSVCASSLRDYGRGWVQVFADSLDRNEIIASLRSGNFYSSTGPTMSVSVSGTAITAVTDSRGEIYWIGPGGVILQSNSNVTSASYSVTGAQSYVRIRIIRDSDTKKAWSNPLWVSGNESTATTTTATTLVWETSAKTMSFHMYSVVYRSSNTIHIYNGADTSPPTQTSPIVASVSCNLPISELSQFLPPESQSLLSGSDAWVGIVSWVTQPLARDTTIRGVVNMTVWMNAVQVEVEKSAYAFGIGESDGRARPIGEPAYQYRAGAGSILGLSPQPYELAVNVDHTFTKGNIIAFVVAVAATTQGWRYEVRFDSPSTNSHVTVPMFAEVPIGEFTQTPALITMSLIVLFLVASRRTRRRRMFEQLVPHCLRVVSTTHPHNSLFFSYVTFPRILPTHLLDSRSGRGLT